MKHPIEAFRTKSPKRVVVVDDSNDWACLLGFLLEAQGHLPSIANSPAEALGLDPSQPISWFILDIDLPGMDGYALGRELREMHPKAVFVGNSGYPRDVAREKAAGFSFDFFFVKPWDFKVLAGLLDSFYPAPSANGK